MSPRVGTRRRARLAYVFVCAGLLSIVSGLNVRAGAGVEPAGPITVTSKMSVTIVVPDPTVGTVQLDDIAGQMTGTVDADGNLFFPQANVSFDAKNAVILLPVTIEPTAVSDWTGTVDPETGAVTLSGQLAMVTNAPGVIVDCPVGPADVSWSTANAGGVAYDGTSGTATVVDAAIVQQPLDSAACAGNGALINTVLVLPNDPGNYVVEQELTFDPIVTAATTSTTEPTTTTTEPTTSTTEPTTTTTTTTTTPSSTTTTTTPSSTTTVGTAGATTTTTTTAAGAGATTTTTQASAAGAGATGTTTTTTVASSAQQSGTLPRTGGGPSAPLVAAGSFLLAGGGALLLAQRRRLA